MNHKNKSLWCKLFHRKMKYFLCLKCNKEYYDHLGKIARGEVRIRPKAKFTGAGVMMEKQAGSGDFIEWEIDNENRS